MSDNNKPAAPAQTMKTICPGIHVNMALGNDISIDTDMGVLQLDTGLNSRMATSLLTQLRERTKSPIHTILYTHGHNGHNSGVTAFLEWAESHDEPRPTIIAQERLVVRWRRYQETFELQNMMAAQQFRVPPGYPAIANVYVYPDITFKDSITLNMGNRIIEVLSAPSETDDAIALWIAKEKILYAGPAFINACPNPGTPYRSPRDPARWADTLDRLAALGPEFLIPPNGDPLEGGEKIKHIFSTTSQALRYIKDETVKRMNQGMTDVEILHDITYPPELFELPWMYPGYGCPDYIVRDVYRAENGWWDRNPTSLHPAHPKDATAEILAAISDKQQVLAHAKALQAEGKTQLALHVIDLMALAQENSPDVLEAKKLKAELLKQRSEDTPSMVSTNLYLSKADRLAEETK